MSRLRSGIVLPRERECRPRAHGRRRWSPTQGFGAVLDPDGTVAWQEDEWQNNALANEGQAAMLNVYLKESALAQWGVGSKYLGLINGGTTAPTVTSTMAYLGGSAGANETQVPAANGYNRQQLVAGTDWTDDGVQAGNWRFSGAQKTFGAASGSTWTITHACMVTAATGQLAGSGKFLLFLAISATTTIAIGQSFVYTLRWTEV